jgi:hypothetical protein
MVAVDQFFECYAVKELHSDEYAPIGFANVMDCADVGRFRADAAQASRWKAVTQLRVVSKFFKQKWESQQTNKPVCRSPAWLCRFRRLGAR